MVDSAEAEIEWDNMDGIERHIANQAQIEEEIRKMKRLNGARNHLQKSFAQKLDAVNTAFQQKNGGTVIRQNKTPCS